MRDKRGKTKGLGGASWGLPGKQGAMSRMGKKEFESKKIKYGFVYEFIAKYGFVYFLMHAVLKMVIKFKSTSILPIQFN